MKAMVLRAYNQDLSLEDVPIPEPCYGELLVRVHACGMCYTDVKIVTGELDGFVTLPHIPGHEVAGEAVEAGPGTDPGLVGRMGVGYFILTCGVCDFCLAGMDNLCQSIRRYGFEENGGYAEYITMPAENFIPYSNELPATTMAVIPDAVATPYHALVNMANLRPGDSLLVVGAGGLGLNAVQIAKVMGLKAIVADIRPAALVQAIALGADGIIDASCLDPLAAAMDVTGGMGFHAVLEGVGSETTMRWTLPALRKGGTCVIMGYDPVNPVPIHLISIHNNQWRLAGTKVSTRLGLKESVALVETGRVKPIIGKTVALPDVNAALADLKKREQVGRTVIAMV